MDATHGPPPNLETVPDVVYQLDAKGRFTVLNQAAENLLGISRTQLLGASVFDYIHPDDRDLLRTTLEADIIEGRSEGRLLNFRVIAKDGTVRHLEVNRRLIFEGDQLVRNEGVARDITAHIVLEETLERYRKIITNSPDAVLILNNAGIFLEQNPAHQQLFGYSDADLQGKTPAYVSSDELFSTINQALYKEGRFTGEIWGQAKNGERIPIELSAFLIKDEAGRVLCQVGFARDLRARKREEIRYRTLVETPNYVVILLNLEGQYLYVSPQVKDWLGYTPEQFYDNSQIAHQIVHPDDIDRLEASFAKALTGTPVPDLEFRWKNQDGAYRWAQRSIFPVRGTDGQIDTLQLVIHDVTEKNEALIGLESANRQLRDTQAKLIHAEKMAALGSLVAGIAHEINTPVGAIRSMHDTLVRAVDKLKAAIEEDFPETYRDHRGLQRALKIIADSNRVIEKGSERVTTIVRSLRNFARLDADQLQEADIHAALDDSLMLIHHDIKNRIEVKREYGPVPPLQCYPGRLNQAFLNILNNAQQAIPEKGTITISTTLHNQQAHISITDTGSGIPDEIRAKIFDPGFTTKGVGKGTGLGLPICLQIIQDHKGQLTVESTPGQGTTFTIVLPLNPASVSQET